MRSLPKLPGRRLAELRPCRAIVVAPKVPSGRTLAPRRSEDQLRPLMMSPAPPLRMTRAPAVLVQEFHFNQTLLADRKKCISAYRARDRLWKFDE